MKAMQSVMWKVGVAPDMTGEKSPCALHWEEVRDERNKEILTLEGSDEEAR